MNQAGSSANVSPESSAWGQCDRLAADELEAATRLLPARLTHPRETFPPSHRKTLPHVRR